MFSGPKDMIQQLIKNFIFGGLAVVSVSYLATFLNPVVAAIWWSYPVSIIPVIYFMRDNKVSNAHISKFLLGITIVSFLTVLCCYLLSYFIKFSSNGLLEPIIKSSLCWGLGCALFYVIVMYSGYNQYFF
jgi:hypothetical protein